MDLLKEPTTKKIGGSNTYVEDPSSPSLFLRKPLGGWALDIISLRFTTGTGFTLVFLGMELEELDSLDNLSEVARNL